MKFGDIVKTSGNRLGYVCYSVEGLNTVLLLDSEPFEDLQAPDDSLIRLGSEKQPVDVEAVKKKYKKYFT